MIPGNFGDLYDSTSGLVGGGTVSGDLHYAFTSRSLDRAGDTLLPIGSTNYVPHQPDSSFAGGQLVGAAPSLGISQKYSNWGMGFFTGVNGTGGGDFSPRIDMAPARVSLFDVWLHLNASGNDSATIVMYTYDNLTAQRQPAAADMPTYTRRITVTGDFSFKALQFISGHADSYPSARWVFSNAVFSRNATAATDCLLNPPVPERGTLLRVY